MVLFQAVWKKWHDFNLVLKCGWTEELVQYGKLSQQTFRKHLIS